MEQNIFYEINLKKYITKELIQNNNIIYDIVGRYKKVYGHTMTRENPDFYMIMLCVDGEGTYICNTTTYSIHTGDLIVCYPHVYTKYFSSSTNPWSLYWAHFITTNSFIQELLYSEEINYEHAVCHISDYSVIVEIFNELLSSQASFCNQSQMNLNQCKFRTLLHLILYKYKNETETNTYITDFYNYVTLNLNKKITLDDLSSELNISKFYLSRLIKSQIGISPIQYIINQRMNQAKIMLTSTNLSINEIALYTGFDNSTFFSNTFKKHMGTSPSNFRNMNSNRL